MENRIKINTGKLGGTKESVENQLRMLERDMQSLQSAMQQLHAAWEGEAYQAITAAINKDLQDLMTVCQMMRKNIVQYEARAIMEYDSCERTVENMISKLG